MTYQIPGIKYRDCGCSNLEIDLVDKGEFSYKFFSKINNNLALFTKNVLRLSMDNADY